MASELVEDGSPRSAIARRTRRSFRFANTVPVLSSTLMAGLACQPRRLGQPNPRKHEGRCQHRLHERRASRQLRDRDGRRAAIGGARGRRALLTAHSETDFAVGDVLVG